MENTDKELAKILHSLAEKFGTTVDHLYAILIKQAYIEAIEWMIGFAIYSILYSIFIYRFRKYYIHKKRGNCDVTEPIWFLLIISSLSMICLIIGIIINVPTMLFNPEYYALKQIIK